MGKSGIASRTARWFGVLALAATMPACRTADGSRTWLFGGPRPDASNTVMRPTYAWPETKPLFLSGYAGAAYEDRGRIRPIFASPTPAPVAAPSTVPSVSVSQGSWEPD